VELLAESLNGCEVRSQDVGPFLWSQVCTVVGVVALSGNGDYGGGHKEEAVGLENAANFGEVRLVGLYMFNNVG